MARWLPFNVPETGLVVVGRRLGPVRAALTDDGHEFGQVPSPAAARTGELDLALGKRVIVGELDQWNAAYGALPKYAEQLAVLAVGLTPGEWRSTFRGDALYPALDDSHTRALLRLPDGSVRRVQLLDGRPIGIERRPE